MVVSPLYATSVSSMHQLILNPKEKIQPYNPGQNLPMKMKPIFAILAFLFSLLLPLPGRAADITVTGSGNWSSTVPDQPWPGGIPPGTNDSVDIELPFTVTVDTNVTVAYLYGSGTATMAPGITLTIVGDANGAYGAQQLGTLDATATGNTVVYEGNSFWAKRTDYYNLVFTNATANAYDFYNGNIGTAGPVAMNIANNMTIVGKVKVQQGADFTINGNLIIGTNSTWDCSSFYLTVNGNTTMGGLLLDLDGALGGDYFAGGITIQSSATGGWNVSDVTQWVVGGSLTNNGLIAGGKGYGSIAFNGTGIITGKPFTIPTLTIGGTYTIGTTITLTTNTPTLSGTVIFDLAHTNQLILNTYPSNPLTLYYSGALQVINSGAPPTAGKSYQFFNAGSYGGEFTSTSFPSLSGGMSWQDNLLTSGSIAVIGGTGSPTLSISRAGNVLTLSWNSTTFPGFSVQAQTNRAGPGSNWHSAGSSTTSPFTTTLDLANPAVFYRLSNH
jgi:hypothetical protein